MISGGFYKIKDKFFVDFPDDYLKTNKSGNRPCYCCFVDHSTGLTWMIPMSARIEKYEALIEKRVAANRPCEILHIAKLDNGRKSAFLIQDMFPIIDDYILEEYTLGGHHLTITSKPLAAVIDHKARTILGLIRKGIKFQPKQPDVLAIEKALLEIHFTNSMK